MGDDVWPLLGDQPSHLCATCKHAKRNAGLPVRCVVNAPAARALVRGEAVRSCPMYAGRDGRRSLQE